MPAPPASAQEGCVLSDRSELTAHRKRQLNVVVWQLLKEWAEVSFFFFFCPKHLHFHWLYLKKITGFCFTLTGLSHNACHPLSECCSHYTLKQTNTESVFLTNQHLCNFLTHQHYFHVGTMRYGLAVWLNMNSERDHYLFLGINFEPSQHHVLFLKEEHMYKTKSRSNLILIHHFGIRLQFSPTGFVLGAEGDL